MKTIKQQILHNMAKAFFVSAWADGADDAANGPNLSGKEITEEMPRKIDPAAHHAAQTLYMNMEKANGKTIVELFNWVKANGDGDRPNTAEMFGHYCAMQAMGHGVGLCDAFGHDVHETIKVPYVEFGEYSLSKEYFPAPVFSLLYRVARYDGKDVPCIFSFELTVNYGNLSCMDNEGLNEAPLDYYRKTKPARKPEHIAACELLAKEFDNMDPDDITAHRRVHKINWEKMRASWYTYTKG